MCGAPRGFLIGGVLAMVLAAPLSASGQGAAGSSAPVTGNVFVGGGAATGIGGRSSVYVQVLYNLSYSDDELSPKGSPWVVRFGIGVGF